MQGAPPPSSSLLRREHTSAHGDDARRGARATLACRSSPLYARTGGRWRAPLMGSSAPLERDGTSAAGPLAPARPSEGTDAIDAESERTFESPMSW